MDTQSRTGTTSVRTDPGRAVGGLRSPVTAGRLGVFGGLLWVGAIALESSKDLQPPASGGLFHLNQAMFAVGLFCWVIVILGYHWLGAAGTGWSRFALPVWAGGVALIAVGSVISLLLFSLVSTSDAVYDDNPLMPVGGIVSLGASLVAGVAVGRAGRLPGSLRWAVLAYALYVLGGLFVPLFLGSEPNAVTESLWGLAWVGLGAVLIRSGPAVEG